MAARNAKRSISTILRKNRGLWVVYKNSSTLLSSSFICALCNRDLHSRISRPALAYTARQDVTEPPQIDHVTPALSLETSPVNYMITKMFKDDRYCYLNNSDDDDDYNNNNNILIMIYHYYYYQYSENNINLKNIQWNRYQLWLAMK